MSAEFVTYILHQDPQNCIRTYHKGHPLSKNRVEGRVLEEFVGEFLPVEHLVSSADFNGIVNQLFIDEEWGNASLGGSIMRLIDKT